MSALLLTVDERALTLVKEAFAVARAGDVARLTELMAIGVPANVCNENGDSLLMLASYHGQLDATRVSAAFCR